MARKNEPSTCRCHGRRCGRRKRAPNPPGRPAPSVNFQHLVIYTPGQQRAKQPQTREIHRNTTLPTNTSAREMCTRSGPGVWENYRSARRTGRCSKAKAEVAARGLVVTVVQNYLAAAAAEKNSTPAARTADAGEKFPASHQALEKGRGSRSFRRNQSGSASPGTPPPASRKRSSNS